MLDIRATHYISPLSEVDFASVVLTVHLVNLADETGLVTGNFRVYDDSTGLLIHSSDIVPFSLAAGQVADVSALTDFDPPAPADDVYFVIFDATAVNQLVPNTIPISLGAFYFDVKPVGMGPAPAAHHATHEDGGSDEIDCTGLAGNPDPHAASHETGGSDEIDITGLVGNPDPHKSSHENGGSDALSGQINPSSVQTSKLFPPANSTTALQITKANGTTNIVNIDTSNSRVGIGLSTPQHVLDVLGGSTFISGITSLLVTLNRSGGDRYCFLAFSSASGPASWYLGMFQISAPYSSDLAISQDTTLANAKLFIQATTGYIGILTSTPTAQLDINSDIIRLRTAKTPANAGAAGNTGDICWDSDYIYVCVATNTWKRTAIATW
jgi:hypothetical protein